MGQTFSPVNFKPLFGIRVFPTLAKIFKFKVSGITKSMDFFSKIVKKSIELRRSGGVVKNDFLQLLLEAQAGQLKEENQEKLDDYEKDAVINSSSETRKESSLILDETTLIAQCILFLAVGADTVETALTYVVYELALHPEVQEKLAAEVTTSMDANDGILPYDVTHQLEYLDMIVSETLRLHPPGFFVERVVTKPYKIPDTNVVVPNGTRMQISITGIHTDPKYYARPTEFFPEHFTTEQKTKRHPYAYMPFGHGPRNCIAMRFALAETKTAIAHLVYNFRVKPCGRSQIPLKLSNQNFKPVNGMWMKFEARR